MIKPKVMFSTEVTLHVLGAETEQVPLGSLTLKEVSKIHQRKKHMKFCLIF